MNIVLQFSACILICFIITTWSAPASQADERKFAFPASYPTGKFSLLREVGNDAIAAPSVVARGNVTVHVSAGQKLVLELNPHCLEHPERLTSMPTAGVDQLFIRYMSMDEDAHVCDKALAAIPVFEKPFSLTCARTDVSDAGLLSFKSLPQVTSLNCFLADIRGSFLKDSKRLQNLQYLNAGHNAIKEDNLKALSQLKSLRNIDLGRTNLTDSGLLQVCKVSELQQLTIRENPRLTDAGLQALTNCPKLTYVCLADDTGITEKSLATLQKLANLINLDLQNTNISAESLEKSSLSKIQKMTLPKRFWEADMIKLRKKFPRTLLNFPNAAVSRETETEFAPVK